MYRYINVWRMEENHKKNKRGLIHHQMMILLAFQVRRYITSMTSSVATEGVHLSVDGGLGWAKPARSDDIRMEVGALVLFQLWPKRESIRLLLVGIYS